MVKTDIMPILDSDMTILLKLCSFLCVFDVFRSKNSCFQKKSKSAQQCSLKPRDNGNIF